MVTEPLFKQYESQTEQLRAIAHPVRIAILHLLQAETCLSVTAIHQSLDIEQATASHHLRILRQAGVLNLQRSGRYVFYTLANPIFSEVLALLKKS